MSLLCQRQNDIDSTRLNTYKPFMWKIEAYKCLELLKKMIDSAPEDDFAVSLFKPEEMALVDELIEKTTNEQTRAICHSVRNYYDTMGEITEKQKQLVKRTYAMQQPFWEKG